MGPTFRALAMIAGFGLVAAAIVDAPNLMFGLGVAAVIAVGIGAWCDLSERLPAQPAAEPVEPSPPGSGYRS